ncbi:MAG: Crp/Fnr family transcriptional regulator, partial [Bacteroidota bacterium]
QYFFALLNSVRVAKKRLLLRQSEKCDQIYFVNKGLLRSYSIGQDGKEATVMFAFADWWITDMYSFVKERPALTNIQAMENSEVLSLSKQNLDQLYQRIPKFERFFRVLMQNAYIREQYRVWENISLTAEKKYSSLLKKYPQIEQQLAQKYIASYLGITPEFLCSMKRRLQKRS